ncbi:NAD(P)/FAD-dependent oxidoreductase [Aureliella helgolandensis]|uniref:NADH:ubiquinone reductase (non-electrogenic) n=1 Tax=Aureliella helgolandensis TaxID=2527968 RepID=A0A518G7A7_9BACT|nr:NAD(P)/FAD-dependent oxidoreductase [Aureliella helgolandensis]QDV24472.1 NADH dehydrogenase-like protein YjlD [Aureliella helgolandensis]
MDKHVQGTPPRVVIVGGGFGGLETAKRLKRSGVQVTLVDKRNYHLFQPLLYQVATGGLSPANIATPLRSILRRQKNCQVIMAEVVDFDVAQQKLYLADGQIDYDFLIVSAGATHSYFGNDAWEPMAPGLKTLQDATEIRRRIYSAFEAAERELDPARREALMTFVVVGGGPTGVELAGALAEIAGHTLKHDFRQINPQDAKILLVEAAEHVLAHYPAELCSRAEAKIRSLGIQVLTQTKVTDVRPEQVHLSGPTGESVIATQNVVWAAGVRGNPLGQKLAQTCQVELDRAGRVPVSASLRVEGQENVFVIGDLANCPGPNGRPLPGLAPVAIQQGRYVANAIASQIAGKAVSEPFSYYDRGSMATIGRAAAVAQIGKRQFCGLLAWIMWLTIHLMLIVQFQNRVLILMQWAWNYITFNRSARLIIEDRTPKTSG